MKRVLLSLGLIVLLILSACSSSSNSESGDASEYPDDQIELIIPFSPGGASDMVSRAVGDELSDDLGTPVTPVNKEGATGTIGMNAVKSSDADGYTIGYVPVELSMVDALDIADIKPEDFTLLGRTHNIPATVTVPADAPYDTIEEFISYAEKHPGEMTFGTSGTGSIWHVAAAQFADEEDLDFNYVSFDGASDAVTSLLGGDIEAVSVSPSEVQSSVDSGDLKVLAVMGEESDPLLPDVPTLKDSGIDVVVDAWGGFVVPKDTPEDIVETLEDSLEKAVDSSEFEELAKSQGLNPAFLPSDEFQDLVQEEYETYKELIPALGI